MSRHFKPSVTSKLNLVQIVGGAFCKALSSEVGILNKDCYYYYYHYHHHHHHHHHYYYYYYKWQVSVIKYLAVRLPVPDPIYTLRRHRETTGSATIPLCAGTHKLDLCIVTSAATTTAVKTRIGAATLITAWHSQASSAYFGVLWMNTLKFLLVNLSSLPNMLSI